MLLTRRASAAQRYIVQDCQIVFNLHHLEQAQLPAVRQQHCERPIRRDIGVAVDAGPDRGARRGAVASLGSYFRQCPGQALAAVQVVLVCAEQPALRAG